MAGAPAPPCGPASRTGGARPATRAAADLAARGRPATRRASGRARRPSSTPTAHGDDGLRDHERSGDRHRGAAAGRALPGTRVQVLDPWLAPVPPGSVGELYVSGVGLARGATTAVRPHRERYCRRPGPARPATACTAPAISSGPGRRRLEFVGGPTSRSRSAATGSSRPSRVSAPRSARGGGGRGHRPRRRTRRALPRRYVVLAGGTTDTVREALSGRLQAYLIRPRGRSSTPCR